LESKDSDVKTIDLATTRWHHQLFSVLIQGGCSSVTKSLLYDIKKETHGTTGFNVCSDEWPEELRISNLIIIKIFQYSLFSVY